jgi:hypothetical protein
LWRRACGDWAWHHQRFRHGRRQFRRTEKRGRAGEGPRGGQAAFQLCLSDELRWRHGLQRQMPLRNLPQPIRFIQQRPFRVQDLRTLAHLFRLTIHFVQFTIQDGDGMLHLI